MAGVSIKPNSPVPPSVGPAPAAPATPATVLPDAPLVSAGTIAGTNDGQTISMPNVEAVPVVAVADTGKLDDDGADYEILHAAVPPFSQGDRVKADRFPEGVDFDRLLKLEAIKSLKDASPEAPAKKVK